MLPLKKIYIDSRDRTPDSVSSSNFKYELPFTTQMPDNTVFFVTDVCIPNVWKTIDLDFNDRLYLYYKTPHPTNFDNFEFKVIQLAEGNYKLDSSTVAESLKTQLQTKLNDALNTVAKSYTSFSVYADAVNNSLTISLTGGRTDVFFKIYTDAEVSNTKGITWSEPVDPNNLMSCNDIFKFVKQMDLSTSVTTGFVNLTHIHNVYITSPNLGSFDTISKFSNNIIKKVPITAGYGFMVIDQLMSTNDFLNCSRQTLKTIEFHLRDGRGREIDLKGMYVSFSIVFNKYNIESL